MSVNYPVLAYYLASARELLRRTGKRRLLSALGLAAARLIGSHRIANAVIDTAGTPPH